MARLVMRPSTHAVFWLFVFVYVSVGSRATEGWAMALGSMALGVLMLWRPFTPEHRPLWWRTILAGAVPLASSIALNLYKFDAVYMFPLKDQVWTQVNEQRQAALAANGGTLSGPQFFTTSFMAYFRPDGIRFTDHFPWVTLPAEAAPAYHGAFVDQTYRTGSITTFMAMFFVLMVVAIVFVFWPGKDPKLARLRIPVIASIIVTGGVMNYGYYATRYASDFVPALVLGAAIGTVLVARLAVRRPKWRAPLVGVIGVGVVFAVLAQMSIGYFMAATLYRGDPLVRYVELQGKVTPDAQAELVRQVEGLPDKGFTDELAIRGKCEALYLHTGDKYEPWVPVEERDQVWRFKLLGDEPEPGRVFVMSFTGTNQVQVWLETDADGDARFLVIRDGRTFYGPRFEIPTNGEFSLGVRNMLDVGFYRIESVPGGTAGFAESVYFDDDWNSRPAIATTEFTSDDMARLGLQGQYELGLETPVCTELARRAGIDVG
jgi:cbb3-type cytochrome oxidase subunit 3